MSIIKERAVNIISHMPEDKVHYVLQLLESINGLLGDTVAEETDEVFANNSSGRKLSPLAGGLIYMADNFDETPDCFKEYM